jgi:membrane protease YdiL (CAAX protease family)
MSRFPPPFPTYPRLASPEPADEREVDIPPWTLLSVPAGIAVGLGIWIVTSVLVAAIAVAGGSNLSHPGPGVSLAQDFLSDLSFVSGALILTVVMSRARASDFGYRRVWLPLALGAFAAAAIGYYVISLVYASIVTLHGSDKLPSELNANHNTAALVGATVFVCVVAPMAEEFFFRGFIFGGLRRMQVRVAGVDLGTWLAAVITGILFGLVHAGSASSQYLVPLGIFGFVLCLLRWRTGSLYPCMALHSVNNALALGVNQLNWNAAEIVGLMVASLAVIGLLTGPLAGPPVPWAARPSARA